MVVGSTFTSTKSNGLIVHFSLRDLWQEEQEYTVRGARSEVFVQMTDP